MTELRRGLDDELLLSRQEFEQYVLDKWDWKEDFVNTSNIYKMS